MRYLVLGSCGMVGSNLSRILLDAGHDVCGIDDLSRGRAEFFDNCGRLEISDIAVDGFSGKFKYDGVFHCAARVGGIGHIQVAHWRNLKNSAIDWAVFQYCMGYGVPLLYVSSCTVCPPWLNYRPLAETDVMSGSPGERAYMPDEGLYGFAKLAGELTVKAVAAEGLHAVAVRMFNVYGPNEIPDSRGHVIPALIGKVLRKELPLEVWGDGTQKRSYLYVDDAARGIIAAMEKGNPGEVYNLGTEVSYTVNQLAGIILEQCGYSPTALRNDPSKPSGVSARYADISKAKRDLGWEPTTSIATGLDKTVRWCREWMERQ